MKRRKNIKKRHFPRRTAGHLTKFRSSLLTTNSSPRPSPMANTSTSARTSSTSQHEHPFRADFLDENNSFISSLHFIPLLHHSTMQNEDNVKHYEYSEFKDVRLIGTGAFGNVFCGHLENKTYALKSFNNDDEQTLKSIVKELTLHTIVHLHENIIQFFGITIETGCWKGNPNERPDIQDVVSELQTIFKSDMLTNTRTQVDLFERRKCINNERF
ncbi:819_t:CDS:2 [Rhizophagus irregularis]|nr:819_t:CDS:2 [Rhizophagus irregularis]